jgi:hypothetical protein
MKSTETRARGLYAFIMGCFTILCIFIFTSSAFCKPLAPSIQPGSGLSASSTKSSIDEKTKVRVIQSYDKLPLQFEANEGQIDGQVKFLSRGSGYSMLFTPTESVLVLSQRDEADRPTPEDQKSGLQESSVSHSKVKSTAIRMRLEGANPAPKIVGEDILPGKNNYFTGSDAKKWRTNISNYKKLRYQEVYPGIDLVYYGNQGKLEYDFVVQPGADPGAIQLSFDGIENYSIENGGDLVLHTALGNVTQKKPIIYQQIKGKRIDVAGNYIFLDGDRVAFHLGDYDKSRLLVIDPVLEYSTFMGTAMGDEGWDIAVDADGNAYVTGATGDFANQTQDVFVNKLNADGSALLYSTILGGGGSDTGRSITVDAGGNAYVTGSTRDAVIDFPTTTEALNVTHNGGTFDGFVIKLNASGELVYSTFIGSSGSDTGLGIVVDTGGSAYVTGSITGPVTDFPTTTGALNETYNGGTFDGFVSKLNATGTALIYSTFLGGNGGDVGNSIALDNDNNVYVTGFAGVGTFPTTPGAFDETHNGGTDVFVSKLNSAGSALLYSTFLGGAGSDVGNGIAVDEDGNAYITGSTDPSNIANFPTTSGAFDEIHGAREDAFVSKLNADGSELLYSTFLGGQDVDLGFGIAVDTGGNAYVTGSTTDFPAADFPTTTGALDETHNGGQDGFVSKLNADGSELLYSTFLGGNGTDRGNGIAVDKDGNAYVTGFAADASTDFPTTSGAFNESHNGSHDVFVSKFSGFILDADGDGVPDSEDNCPADANADQMDRDGDGAGDACDACPNDADNDTDGDGVCGDVDNCPDVDNAGQEDGDGDSVGDVCDNCPVDFNPNQDSAACEANDDAENIDPNNDGSQFAWAEHTGWLNAEPGGDGGPGVIVENDGLRGYLWSETTGWVSLSCENSGNCGDPYGVTNDGTGILAGYAWSEHAGWVSFSCSNDVSCSNNYGVTINPATDEFSGRAWNENTGWISFRSQPEAANTYGVTTSWQLTGEVDTGRVYRDGFESPPTQ